MCGAVTRRSVDVESCARRCFAAATPPHAALGHQKEKADQVLRFHADGQVMRLPHLLDKTSSDRPERRQVDRATGHAAARERRLLRRIHEHGDTRARDQLAEEMLPLARALAGRYANRGEPLDDLVQVACIGIMKAIDGFDLTRVVRFASYATPTVLGEIKRHFRDKTWAMRVPRGVKELQLRVAKARDKLTHELGRSPTVQEIAAAVDAPFEEVLGTIQSASARRTRSLDEPTGEDVTLADSLGAVDPEIERAEMRALIDGAFHILSDREQEVLRLRFDDDLSQAEIAQRIGVSQMQVSRLIKQSLARVRLQIERSPDRMPTIAGRGIPKSHFRRPPAWQSVTGSYRVSASERVSP
jgi:RNA polymerase sigma-B factor